MDHNLSEYGVEVVDADVPGTLMGLLCEACTLLEPEGYFDHFDNPKSSSVSDDLCDWWRGHRERDAERLKVVKEKALAKLTLKEKIALGLVEA